MSEEKTRGQCAQQKKKRKEGQSFGFIFRWGHKHHFKYTAGPAGTPRLSLISSWGPAGQVYYHHHRVQGPLSTSPYYSTPLTGVGAALARFTTTTRTLFHSNKHSPPSASITAAAAPKGGRPQHQPTSAIWGKLNYAPLARFLFT